MALPTTTRAFRRTFDGKSIELVSEDIPQKLLPTQVLLKIHAVSLNFRDVSMIHNRYPFPIIPQGIPCSDASATVLSIGSSVTMVDEGDFVAPTFRETCSGQIKALGGDVDGVLREYAVFDQCDVTKLPSHLSYEEASIIPCAGVTAWTALDFDKKKQGETALMQGTGGVSIFATLLCVAAGITAIITSSSDEKLKKCKALGQAVQGINYRTNEDWAEEARRLTQGKGVDVVINIVGAPAMEQCFKALAKFGTVSLVGHLDGANQTQVPDCFTPVMMQKARLQ